MLDRFFVAFIPRLASTYALEVQRVRLSKLIHDLNLRGNRDMDALIDAMNDRAVIESILRSRGERV